MQDLSPQQIIKSNLIDDLNNPKLKIDPGMLSVPSSSSIKKSQLTIPSTDPKDINKNGEVSSTKITNAQAEAALSWLKFGLNVIPIIPGTKRTAVKWNEWQDGLSPEKITQYWKKHPDHEFGFIVGDNIIVFDADSPESIAALAKLEAKLGIESKLVVTTNKGQHHYYRLAKNTIAKTDTHGTEEHPERIDVKTGRSMVILPPSTGKIVQIEIATNASELTEANQEVIDAVFQHNESPRILRRLQILREWSDEQNKQIFPRSKRTSSPSGARASQ